MRRTLSETLRVIVNRSLSGCENLTIPTVFVATWRDGLFVVAGETPAQELANQSVRALTSDGRGGALAIVDGHSLRRRTPDGRWSTLAKSESGVFRIGMVSFGR